MANELLSLLQTTPGSPFYDGGAPTFDTSATPNPAPVVHHAYDPIYGRATALQTAAKTVNAAAGKVGFSGIPHTPGTVLGLPYWAAGLGVLAVGGVVLLALKKK
jgi:hypothetical protein